MVSNELLDPSQHFQVPQQILDRLLHLRNNFTISQVLVKWSHLPLNLSTWEDEEALCQQFPRTGLETSRSLRKGEFTNTGAGTVAAGDTSEAGGPKPKADEGSAPEPDKPEADEGIVLRSARSRRPNPFVYGPEWA
jgi:hypothetical protein